MSSAVWYLWSGSFAIARRAMASSEPGTSMFWVDGAAGSEETCW